MSPASTYKNIPGLHLSVQINAGFLCSRVWGRAGGGIRGGCLGLQRARDAGDGQTDRLTAGLGPGAQSSPAPRPASHVKFLGYGGSFVWGSAVGRAPIFRVVDPAPC